MAVIKIEKHTRTLETFFRKAWAQFTQDAEADLGENLAMLLASCVTGPFVTICRVICVVLSLESCCTCRHIRRPPPVGRTSPPPDWVLPTPDPGPTPPPQFHAGLTPHRPHDLIT